MLIEAYSPRHKKAISLILDAQDVSDEVAIKVIKKGFDSPKLLFQLIEGFVYTSVNLDESGNIYVATNGGLSISN